MQKLIAIRGATTIAADTRCNIESSSIELFNEILVRNSLSQEQIVSVQITSTKDITAYYPAAALRKNGCAAPLFSALEPDIKDSLPLCIRFLFLAYGEKPVPVYLRGAADLLK